MYSMVTFWPSKKPASPRPLRNACNTGPVSSGERALKNPITGLAACCARAENGQAAVAPPSNLMNSRRLMAAPAAWTSLIVSVQVARLKGHPPREVGRCPLWVRRTCAVQNLMSALPPIATAKADIGKQSCLLYPQERTCAARWLMSALGQKRTFVVAPVNGLPRYLDARK